MRRALFTFCLLAPACLLVKDLDALEGGALDASVAPASSDASPLPSGDASTEDDAASDAGSMPTDGGEGGTDAGRCAGHAGPPSVWLPTLGFCMDQTEVTVGDYRAFLTERAGQITPDDDPRCTGNTSYAPGYPLPSAAQDREAVHAVDFCDARAYCAWAGKRLCGKRGGGTLAFGERTDPTQSEWMAVCTHNGDGLHRLVYGNELVEARCNDAIAYAARDASTPVVDVGSFPECAGPFGVLDLSGNVSEWEDTCESTDAGLRCAARGGAYYHPLIFSLECAGTDPEAVEARTYGFGVRCCSDVL